MNYELAKKLKEAGFPQELNNGDWAYFTDKDEYTDNEIHLMHDDNDEGCFVGNSYSHRYFDHDPTSWTKVPTLSELIEACGTWIDLYGYNDRWYASPNTANENRNIYYGSSPEEAVARLWLSLNKN